MALLLDRVRHSRIALLPRPRTAPSGFPPAESKARAGSTMFLWPKYRQGRPYQYYAGDFANYAQEGFSINSIIYSAIMYKVRAQWGTPLRAYVGDPDHPELLPLDHPLTKLCERPNPHQSWAEFQGQNEVYFNLSGNCYILKIKSRKYDWPPEQLISLRPDQVYFVPNPKDKKQLMGFLYRQEGQSFRDAMPILAQDLIHVKLPNPLDPFQGLGPGLSPMSAIAYAGDVDNAVTKFLKAFFDRGTIVSGVLKFDTPLDADTVAAIKLRWQQQYGGYENWTDVGVLDQGGEYQRLAMTFDEMGFAVIDERSEHRMLGPFGVPGILINTRSGWIKSSYANYETAKRQFWEDTFVTELMMFEDEYRYHLRGPGGEFVAFDLSGVEELKRELPPLVAAWTQMVDRGIPKAVAGEVIGLKLPELPDGDVIYLSPTMIPSGKMGEELSEIAPSLAAPAPPKEEVGASAEEEAKEEGGKGLTPPFRQEVRRQSEASDWLDHRQDGD